MTTDQQDEPGDGRTVVLHREYPDPIDDVWAALTQPDRLARWIGSYTGRGSAGGNVEFTVTGEVDAGGEVAASVTVTILECAPPRRLVVDIPESGGGASWRVAVTLSNEGTGSTAGAGGDESGPTVLRFEQHVVAGTDPADIEAGWRWYLDRLGAALHGDPMPAWADYLPAG